MSAVRRRLAAQLTVLLLGSLAAGGAFAAAAAAAPPEDPRPAFRIRDPRITESSSLVLSRSNPDLAYTANDGSSARVFTVDMTSGRTVGVTTLAGVEPVDIEAMAPGPEGTLYVGDIGDNTDERESISVYAIPEPGRGKASVEPESFELTYVDGPRDAEALLVHPSTGRLFVVSKEPLGAEVYAAPTELAADRANQLRPLAPVQGLVTDGTFLPDGSTAVLRLYGAAASYRLPTWERIELYRLPKTQQGESIASVPDGSAILVGSEGTRSPVFSVDLPQLSAGPNPTAAPAPDGEPQLASGDRSGLLAGGAVVVLLVLAGVAALAGRRTR